MPKKPKRKPRNKPKKAAFSNRPLADLSRLKPAVGKSTASPAAGEKSAPPTRDEQQEFLSAMADVKPMAGSAAPKKNRPRPSGPPGEEKEAREVMQALRELVDGEAPLSIHETDEAIEGSMEGLDPRILAKLRRGEFSIQDHLDLHGYNREEARAKVESFLLSAMAQDKRCILIIHGRGHGSKDRIPVLKNALKSWFTRRALRKKILAFTTARPCDGGAGAVYVLLKKFRSR